MQQARQETRRDAEIDGLKACGDEIERIVRWKGGSDVSRLSGQPVRLRFVMKDADLYSFQFTIKKRES